MNIFDKFFKLKPMPEENNSPETNDTQTESVETTTPAADSRIKTESEIKSDRELTKEVLAKAISLFNTDNPGKVWEDVDQQTRWDYIDKAY